SYKTSTAFSSSILLCTVPRFALSSLPSFSSFFFYSSRHHRDLHSFPTRRSSDLFNLPQRKKILAQRINQAFADPLQMIKMNTDQDRKSTRLNSSHVSISYAVFCLKKKNILEIQ